MVLISSIGYLD
uniref:Uncharacterized protein n=1 Tax=Arundo donax TaxID=35708 RepID=A0A0A8Y6L2_ARUDO